MIELIGPLVFWFFVAQAKLTTGTHKLRASPVIGFSKVARLGGEPILRRHFAWG